MKEIYVYKSMFGGWTGISKEEADEKIKADRVFGVELEMDRGEDEPIKITLLKDNFGAFFGVTDEMTTQLANEYFAYVESITGMVTNQA